MSVLSDSFAGLSKTVSHALRHEPWHYNIEVDEQGWTAIEGLLEALRRESDDWASLERRDLETMIAESPKPRHEIMGSRIRALHGHSLPGQIQLEPSTPPQQLFHGTSVANLPSIESQGLLPSGRQYVHLSQDVGTAELVGRRKKGKTIILRVDAASAGNDGVLFYRRSDVVWLATGIAPDFIQILDDRAFDISQNVGPSEDPELE